MGFCCVIYFTLSRCIYLKAGDQVLRFQRSSLVTGGIERIQSTTQPAVSPLDILRRSEAHVRCMLQSCGYDAARPTGSKFEQFGQSWSTAKAFLRHLTQIHLCD